VLLSRTNNLFVQPQHAGTEVFLGVLQVKFLGNRVTRTASASCVAPRMRAAAAEKTGEMVGGGTSTATLLAHAIFADGVRNVVAGASAIDIKRGLDRASKRSIEAGKELIVRHRIASNAVEDTDTKSGPIGLDARQRPLAGCPGGLVFE
jgi:hypothetical protein